MLVNPVLRAARLSALLLLVVFVCARAADASSAVGAQIDESSIDVELYLDVDNPAASDTNDGLSPSQPLKTLQRAIDLAKVELGAGPNGKSVRINLAAGRYEETGVQANGMNAKQQSNLLVIQGPAGADKAIISGSTGT